MAELFNRELKELKRFVKSRIIPVSVGQPEHLSENYHIQVLHFLGFRNISKNMSFFNTVFPNNWHLRIMEFSNNWVYLIDNRGRKRAAIFYKFIEKEKSGKVKRVNSFINYIPRYRIIIDRIEKLNIFKTKDAEYMSYYYSLPIVGGVYDGNIDNYIMRSDEIVMDLDYSDVKERRKREVDVRNELYKMYYEKMIAEFPDADNIIAYWDDNEKYKEIMLPEIEIPKEVLPAGESPGLSENSVNEETEEKKVDL